MYKEEVYKEKTLSQQSVARPEPGKYLFVLRPCGRDFYKLAQHVAAAPPQTLHSSLRLQRVQVAQRLRQMGDAVGEKEAEREEHQAAYHALRLLVW